MSDLIERLRALSRHEHDDLSIGDEAADEIERRHGIGGELIIASRERDEAIAERDALRARIEGSVSGVVLQAGDDESGLARVIVHCSREALSSGPNLIGKRVAPVVLEGGES